MEKFLVEAKGGYKEVAGERCTIAGVECFTFTGECEDDHGRWDETVYAHLATGWGITSDIDPDIAREKAFNLISMNKEAIEIKIKQIGKTINV